MLVTSMSQHTIESGQSQLVSHGWGMFRANIVGASLRAWLAARAGESAAVDELPLDVCIAEQDENELSTAFGAKVRKDQRKMLVNDIIVEVRADLYNNLVRTASSTPGCESRTLIGKAQHLVLRGWP